MSDSLENIKYHRDRQSYIRQFYLDYLKRGVFPEQEQSTYKSGTFTDAKKVNICPFSYTIKKYIPAFCREVPFVVPCGKCMYCKHKRQNSLIYRIYLHSKSYKNSLFVTLTYNDAHYPLDNRKCVIDGQKFFKRLRRKLDDCTISYFHVCERGKKSGRLHHHFLLFWNGDCSKTLMRSLINECWKAPAPLRYESKEKIDYKAAQVHMRSRKGATSIGFTYFGSVSPYSITYVTKYCLKDDIELNVYSHWSNGLGLGVLEVVSDMQEKLKYLRFMLYQPDPTNPKVRQVAVPKYYKDKLLTPLDRANKLADYLDSQYYKDLLSAVSNPSIMTHYEEMFKTYVNKTLLRASVHERERIARCTDI